MATYSTVLAWRTPGTGELGGLPCMGSHRVGHDWSDLVAAAAALVTSQGILRARILEPVAMPSSRGSSQPGIEPRSLFCRQILHHLSHQGSPRILEWVAYPLSSGSSRPRNQTWVSCIAGEFSTNSYQGSPGSKGRGGTQIVQSFVNICF